MKKDAIKIVKRNKKNAAEKTPPVADAPKIKNDTQTAMVNKVKNWISERRENSRTEKVFSDDKILGWK